MDLTAWQRICNRLLGPFVKKRARNDKELSANLVKGSMGMMPEVYLSTVIVTSIAITLMSWAFVAVFFIPDIGVIAFYESLQDASTLNPCFEWEYWNPDLIDPSQPGNGCPDYALQVFPAALKVIIVALGGFIVPYAAYKYNKGGAKREATRRADMIEKYLPYAASYTAAMSAANATPAKIFRSLAMNKDIYGDVADDAAMIYRDITLLGYDLICLLYTSPSPRDRG